MGVVVGVCVGVYGCVYVCLQNGRYWMDPQTRDLMFLYFMAWEKYSF